MKPKGAVRNASSVEAALPRSLDELARIAGGPFALIEQAEQQAGDQEARFWLDVLEHHVAQALAEGHGGRFDAVRDRPWVAQEPALEAWRQAVAWCDQGSDP